MVVIIDGKKVLVTQGRVVIRNGVAELGLVLAIEHQGNAELGGHLGGQLLWPKMNGWNGWNRFSVARRVSRRWVMPLGVHR